MGFKTNEYFDGAVASIALDSIEGDATVGVMAKGNYTFGTSRLELMTVISGSMDVKRPGETEFTTFKKFETFTVEKDVKFEVKVAQDTPYICVYK